MKRFCLIVIIFLISFIFESQLISRQRFEVGGDLLKKPLTRNSIETFPVPKDFRNYFLLQSIDNETRIVIGDFVGAIQTICLIVDKDNDNTIDKVYEYYPGISKKAKVVQKPTTTLFEGLEKTKRGIITGEIYKYTYSYKMYSINDFKYKVDRNEDVSKYDQGYRVRIPSRQNGIFSGEMFFGHFLGGYHILMKTNFYYIYKSQIYPVVPFSVYCENTNDPIIKEYVEQLIKKMKEFD